MKNFFGSLFWKIWAAFLFILIIISAVYMYISVNTAEMYFQETRQKLDVSIAAHIAGENRCFINGEVNTSVLKQVFHNVMVINPSIEVYLLDTAGTILTYYAPDKIITIKKVPLEPIISIIESDQEVFVLGLDPKNPRSKKAFSASTVFEDELFRGYIYVILGGEEYENASQLVFGSFILRLGVRSMIVALITAAIIGFILIGYITRNMRKIISVINNFQNGDLNARIIMKGKGELNEFAFAFNDMADTIVSNIDEIKKMDNLRRELIANVSHDLRTPLAVIQGYIETVMIKSDSLSEDEKNNYLTTIHSSTQNLLKLVEELFELSKLEAKQIEPNFEKLSIAELLQDIYQKNMVLAKTKNIDLKLEMDEKLPMINADMGMMERVFQNLLDNAFKFTPETGSIIISLTGDNKNIIVKVIDTGFGIDAEYLPNIFDRYQKTKRISVKSNEGLGLGLAIVKKILDLHKININVESEKEKGTVFTLSIPCLPT